jgi:hypothetical protein
LSNFTPMPHLTPSHLHTSSDVQALFQQVLSQLSTVPGLQQSAQQPAQAPSSNTDSLASSSLVQLVEQQQPECCLHLEQLLHGAAVWFKAAVQDPAAAGSWQGGQTWQQGQLLLQLATTTCQQALQQQLSLDRSSKQPDKWPGLLLELVGSQSEAMAAAQQADGVGSAGVAAAASVMQSACQLVQDCQQLQLLSAASCQQIHQQLLQLLLPPAGTVSNWPGLHSSPEAVLQAATAGDAAAAGGVLSWQQQQHPQILQVLGMLLRQNSSWEELAGLFSADADATAGDAGMDQLLQLVLLVLRAVAVQAEAQQSAAAATEAAAERAAQQEATAVESDSEPDYFHDIFGSDGAADEGATAAAAAVNSVPTVIYEEALSQLAVQLLGGLVSHLSGKAVDRSDSSSSRGDTTDTWGLFEQRMLQMALCFIALKLPSTGPQEQQEQQQDEERPGGLCELLAVQQAMQAAVQQLCSSSVAAAQQLQDTVLLCPAGQTSCSVALLQLAGGVMLQNAASAASAAHAAALASAGPAATAATDAVTADAGRELLISPWLHLATQLAHTTEEAVVLCSNDSSSALQLQEQLAWLLSPGRLSLVLAVALAAPGPERALMASVMLHCLQRCSDALAAAPAGSTTSTAIQRAADDEAGVSNDSNSDSTGGSVGARALVLCSVHACVSALLWLLLPPTLLPTAWLQRNLQDTLQPQHKRRETADVRSAAVASSSGAVGAVVQLREEPWPAGLAWVAALLQYKHETDELPALLESLGGSVDTSAQVGAAAHTGRTPGTVKRAVPSPAQFEQQDLGCLRMPHAGVPASHACLHMHCLCDTPIAPGCQQCAPLLCILYVFHRRPWLYSCQASSPAAYQTWVQQTRLS